MTSTQSEIFSEMIKAMEILGAQSDLLCIVCSFQDTLPDEMVLNELRDWNAIVGSDKVSLSSLDH